MQKVLPLLALSGALLSACPALAQPTASPTRLLVRLNDEVAAELAQRTPASPKALAFAQLNRRLGAELVQPLNPGAAAGPAVYLITLPAGTDARQALAAYASTGLFRYVEPDGTGQADGAQGFVPNESLYGRQWGLRNNGSFAQAPARANADINMENAWTITRGDSTVTVAIIDSGCKLDHSEFSGRIWRNRRELPANGLDDDGNGYVDDVRGWNFVNATNDPTDDHGHGTNVAGIIGATGNNGVGYAGVNWGCKLMICKGLDAQNNGFYSWWTAAIYYAVNNGARVINMSLGGLTTSQTMQDAVTYANQRGAVVVVSTGNANSNTPQYPSAMTGALAVGATNPDDTRCNPFFWSTTSGSNFGPHLSVVAPGNFIYGLYHLSNTNFNTYWGGTSQAAPHVAGVASLLLTLRPQLTAAQVKATLQATADDRVGPATEDAPGWDPYFGFGRINAGRALASVVSGTAPALAAAPAFQVYPNPTHGSISLSVADRQLLGQEVQIFNALGQLVFRHASGTSSLPLPATLVPGTYWVKLGNSGQRLIIE